jgi:carbon monoxide dehydrogenase subunit G
MATQTPPLVATPNSSTLPVQVTFEVDENPPNSIQSRAVAGSLRSITSSYALTPVPSGTRLDYLGHVAPGFELFGRFEKAAVEQNIARQFQALADEIERQGELAHAHRVEGTR